MQNIEFPIQSTEGSEINNCLSSLNFQSLKVVGSRPNCLLAKREGAKELTIKAACKIIVFSKQQL